MTLEVQDAQVLVSRKVLLDVLLYSYWRLVQVQLLDRSEVPFQPGKPFQHLLKPPLLVVHLQVTQGANVVQTRRTLLAVEVELKPLYKLATIATHVRLGLVVPDGDLLTLDTVDVLAMPKLLRLALEHQGMFVQIVFPIVKAVEHDAKLDNSPVGRSSLLVQEVSEVVVFVLVSLSST